MPFIDSLEMLRTLDQTRGQVDVLNGRSCSIAAHIVLKHCTEYSKVGLNRVVLEHSMCVTEIQLFHCVSPPGNLLVHRTGEGADTRSSIRRAIAAEV